LGIELQPVVGATVCHIKHMYHALAFLGGVHQAGFGKVYPLAIVLHALGKTTQAAAGIFKVVGYDANFFVD
jgi:hypothetical protein